MVDYRDESGYADSLGILSAGPLGGFAASMVVTNADGYRYVVAPMVDGYTWQGLKVDGNLNVTKYQPGMGLRYITGSDPANSSTDYFSLGQGSPQVWEPNVYAAVSKHRRPSHPTGAALGPSDDVEVFSFRGLCKKERYRKAFEIARSLPGIGWFTAIRLILELGEDLSHFTTGKKIASFVGLTSSEYSTGETERKGASPAWARGSSDRPRRELLGGIKKDQALLSKFSRVWRSSGSKKKAIVAVARVLIVRFGRASYAGTTYSDRSGTIEARGRA